MLLNLTYRIDIHVHERRSVCWIVHMVSCRPYFRNLKIQLIGLELGFSLKTNPEIQVSLVHRHLMSDKWSVITLGTVTWSMKIRCTDRELPTVEDRCERCDLTPVQYSNRRVVGTVHVSHKKKGSITGEVNAERQKSNTDRDCRWFEDLTRCGLSGTFTHSGSHRVTISCTYVFPFHTQQCDHETQNTRCV